MRCARHQMIAIRQLFSGRERTTNTHRAISVSTRTEPVRAAAVPESASREYALMASTPVHAQV